MYSKKLGVSGTYWAVISNMIGAAAQTSANWRQSKVAPIAKDANKPICDDILLAEHRLPRIDGCAISLI